MITYHIQVKHIGARLFEVRMELSATKKKQVFSLPNWIPGSYLIRDFSRNLGTVKAYLQNNEEVPIEKINSNTWHCDSHEQPLTLVYTVYAGDFSVRGAYILDETTAFFNASSLCLQAHGFENEQHRIHLSAPKNLKWRVATTLTAEANAWDFGWYFAPNYDVLIDNPVQLGIFELLEFDVRGIPHYIAVFGKHCDADLNRLKLDVQKLCETHISLFGEAPFERYLFLLNLSKDYGGLEHQCCSALQIQRDTLPIMGDASLSKGYITLLALFSHEYFHAWNVKRIRPECFTNYQLDNKCYTNSLWAFEGITSYYDELALVRAKIITKEQYFELLAQSVTRLLRNSGRAKQTLIESSYDAWIKFYQPNDNAINSQVSYYLKGSLAAWLFDMALRLQSQNARSLDDVMVQLWQEYGKENKGVKEKDIENIINQMANNQLTNLIHDALYTTKDLPLSDWLARVGLVLNLRGSTLWDDFGGNRKLEANGNGNGVKFQQGVFGFQISKGPRVVVTQVFDNGAAQEAGICPQDEIVAINGFRIDGESYDRIARRLPIGKTVDVTIFRQDILQHRQVVLKAPPLDTAELTLKTQVTAEQMEYLEKWLMI